MNTKTLTIRPQHSVAVPLTEVLSLEQADFLGGSTHAKATGVTLDSRDVRPNDLYIGMPGATRHGAEFWPAAKALGAVAIMTDDAGKKMVESMPDCAEDNIIVTKKHPRLMLGEVAAKIYGTKDPDALVFGVTGTNGKTSVVYILEALMRSLGMVTAISTTAERRIGETAIESDLTSPEASELHGLIARMTEEGVEGIGIEVSAQAVERHRIDGLIFDCVAFNNFSQDHLDEFGDMQTYFNAKLGLFDPKHAKRGVVVVDSIDGQRIARLSKIPVTTLATQYGQAADWHMAVTRHTIDGISFVLQGPNDAYFRGSVPLFGSFMAENTALALIMLNEAGIALETVQSALGGKPLDVQIPGRMELMSEPGKGPRFYVDYAHTPGSFISVLDALQELKEGRIIFMFGADGNRDTTKREAMGKIASEGSDLLIICDYHPRLEDPQAIRGQLLAGAKAARRPAETHEIADPKEAMRFAIANASEQDIIVYAGPGHESYQEVAGEQIAYVAREEVRKALGEAGLLGA